MEDLSRFFDIELSTGQHRAVQGILEFINSEDDKVFILKGYAGTGKTTLTRGLINWLGKEGIPYMLLASTGRATKVLSDATGCRVSTIHSHLYVYDGLSEDLEALSKHPGAGDKHVKLLFKKKTKPAHEGKRVYIIDEASMIPDTEAHGSFADFGSGKVLSDLFEYDPESKYIFVGDPLQLPPVKQEFSPALSSAYIREHFGVKCREAELTDIHRQSERSGIIEASMNLRKIYHQNPQVKFARFPFKHHRNIKVHDSHAAMINDTYNKNFEEVTIICQTNRHCTELNKMVRSLHGLDPYHPEAGDILMVTQNNLPTGLVNGDFVRLLDTGDTTDVNGIKMIEVEIEELVSEDRFNTLLFLDVLHSGKTNISNDEHRELMIDYFYRMKEIGIKQKDPAFSERMRTDPYLNALRAVYGYAITCHKSQGGEWDEVYLYLDNKIHGIPKPHIYRWMYTAVTRATDILHVVDDWFIH